jgi:hypothetical protein
VVSEAQRYGVADHCTDSDPSQTDVGSPGIGMPLLTLKWFAKSYLLCIFLAERQKTWVKHSDRSLTSQSALELICVPD